MLGRKIEESTDTAFRGMTYACIAVTVAWVVLGIACLVWQFIQQRMISKKINSPKG